MALTRDDEYVDETESDTDTDVSMTLSKIGLDSLMAIELCRWLRQVFGIAMSVLEVMGTGTLLQLGEVVRDKLLAGA